MHVKIENWMRYSYEEPVSFSTHGIRLYPRTDQSITTHQIQTTVNIESDIQYRQDLFDNIVANCFLPTPSQVLEIGSNSRLNSAKESISFPPRPARAPASV
jgi:hypothetical protein